eukprot:gene45822-61247_t
MSKDDRMILSPSRTSDGFFFLSYLNGNSLHVLHGGASGGSISSPIRFSSGMPDKTKGTIKAVHSHPTKPYIFIINTLGGIQDMQGYNEDNDDPNDGENGDVAGNANKVTTTDNHLSVRPAALLQPPSESLQHSKNSHIGAKGF